MTNEIERQRHYNLVLLRLMYENACPDVPGTWAGFQEQILPIGTKGSVPSSTIGPPKETRTALAWVETGDQAVLMLATKRFRDRDDSDSRDGSMPNSRISPCV